ncbi:hypothetical protein Cri9333_0485 [Crinalium epipsammum PCC 9333]|uniref:Circadian oscillating protein COP23 n=1 Tax=Crinalium epipsammum PCC 9333 TaxID=1173022 RepID=K9VV58_9CYAN|nr:COP23 domain-containing protein [Crinalium epipsammum]AFZ11449.1 hypothetical protein Cri9333_0485 [Crinalium epipsammum PCC 9333]
MRLSTIRNLSVLVTAISLTLNAAPSFSQTQPDKVTFYCRSMLDITSGENIPTTVAWIPERQGHIRLIGWKSEYFYRWNPQARCQAVTQKIQNLSNQGRFNFLATGAVNNYPVICAFASQGESCDSNNQVFTIKPHDNPDEVLAHLLGIFEGRASKIFNQSSGQKRTLSVNSYFQKAPLIEIPTSSK